MTDNIPSSNQHQVSISLCGEDRLSVSALGEGDLLAIACSPAFSPPASRYDSPEIAELLVAAGSGSGGSVLLDISTLNPSLHGHVAVFGTGPIPLPAARGCAGIEATQRRYQPACDSAAEAISLAADLGKKVLVLDAEALVSAMGAEAVAVLVCRIRILSAHGSLGSLRHIHIFASTLDGASTHLEDAVNTDGVLCHLCPFTRN